ncbi:MAG: hypothetical protein QXG05_01275 [Nitrososphaerota archaeon]
MTDYKIVVSGFAKGIGSIVIFWGLQQYFLPELSIYSQVNSLSNMLVYGIIIGFTFIISSLLQGDRLRGAGDILWGIASILILFLAFPSGVLLLKFFSPAFGKVTFEVKLLPVLFIVLIIPLVEIARGAVIIINSQRHINGTAGG